jgi:hypothetical protein
MITAGIATLVEREASFKLAIKSIYPQVDKIVAVLNNYILPIPWWMGELSKLEVIFCGDNHLGASGKFFGVDEGREYALTTGCDDYYLSCDDDLVYPPTYVKDMLAKVKEHNCIISLHGKRYDGERPIKSYKRSITTNVHCLHTFPRDVQVHVGGTGVMAFNTRQFKFNIDDLTFPNMVDVQVAKLAHQQNIPIMALAHQRGYLKYMTPPNGTTLWNTTSDTILTNILNSFL